MTCALKGILTVVIAAGLLVGCSSSGGAGSTSDGGGSRDGTRTDTSSGACKPGTKSSCECPGGDPSGVKVCNAKGDGYGACTGCSTTDASTGADASDAGHPVQHHKDARVDAPEDASGGDASGGDAASFDATATDATRKDATERDATEKDASRKDAGKKDASEKDATGRDVSGKDSAGHDAAEYDAPGFDAAGHDAAGQDATAVDATGHDAPAPGCTFGDQICNGQQPEICTASGTWTDLGTCSGSTPACLGGSCVECSPGVTACTGSTGSGLGTGIETCSGSGQWEPSVPCSQPTPACSEGGGTPSCICPGSYAICGSACVDLDTDNANCGRCGNPCTGTGESCQNGTCVPTWTYLFNTYLAAGTPGNCAACHYVGYYGYSGGCDDPVDCYDFIGNGLWGGLSAGGGLFSWDEGDMPSGGPTSLPQADIDFGAWIAVGSPDN